MDTERGCAAGHNAWYWQTRCRQFRFQCGKRGESLLAGSSPFCRIFLSNMAVVNMQTSRLKTRQGGDQTVQLSSIRIRRNARTMLPDINVQKNLQPAVRPPFTSAVRGQA